MKNFIQFILIFLFAQVISIAAFTSQARATEAGVVAPGCNQPGMCPTKASVPCNKLSGPCKTAAHQVITGLPDPASKESPKAKNNSEKRATK